MIQSFNPYWCMNMEQWWKHNWPGEIQVPGKETIPQRTTFPPRQIGPRPDRGPTRGSKVLLLLVKTFDHFPYSSVPFCSHLSLCMLNARIFSTCDTTFVSLYLLCPCTLIRTSLLAVSCASQKLRPCMFIKNTYMKLNTVNTSVIVCVFSQGYNTGNMFRRILVMAFQKVRIHNSNQCVEETESRFTFDAAHVDYHFFPNRQLLKRDTTL